VGICYGPAFVKIKSISFGPQIGVQSIALVLVIFNERGMEGFMEDNFTLGGTASIAAGPLGRSLSADTDYKFKASIYSYSISKGAYIGVSFQGSAIEEDSEANELFYGKSISNRSLLGNKITVNPAVLKLLLMIKKVSK
jgi:lipid-binding SYLF domain-containing protein